MVPFSDFTTNEREIHRSLPFPSSSSPSPRARGSVTLAAEESRNVFSRGDTTKEPSDRLCYFPSSFFTVEDGVRFREWWRKEEGVIFEIGGADETEFEPETERCLFGHA